MAFFEFLESGDLSKSLTVIKTRPRLGDYGPDVIIDANRYDETVNIQYSGMTLSELLAEKVKCKTRKGVFTYTVINRNNGGTIEAFTGMPSAINWQRMKGSELFQGSFRLRRTDV